MAKMVTLDLTPRMIGKRVRVEGEDMAIEGVLSHLTTDVEAVGPMTSLGGEVLRDKSYRLVGIEANVGGHWLHLTGHESLEEL